MKGIVLVSTLNKAFDEKLIGAFAREGFSVYAMGNMVVEGAALLPMDAYEAAAALKEKAAKLDYLLDTTDASDPRDSFTVRDGIDGAVMEQVYRRNVLRSMALLEAFLPLLDEGRAKRLFYLTSAEASINETRRINHFAYNMSKAALHQFIQMTRNKLSSRGYSFRVFDPMYSEVSVEAAAESAYNYIIRRRGTENHDPMRDDEDNLVFRDAQGRQHSW